MITKEQLQDLLFKTVSGKLRHKHYDRTVYLAGLYSKIISGKGIDTLLKQFVRREDKVMFDQRVNLTQQITPSISNGIIKTFNKVFRTTPAIESIDFEGDNVETKIEEVKAVLKKIYGEKDVYKYIQDRFTYLTFCDPNAFIYTTFKSFDNEVEKPQPYNLEISSEAAINYEYFNNELQWLISRVDNTYIENNKTKTGSIYAVYGREYAYVLTQVGSDYKPVEGQQIKKLPVLNGKEFEYFIFDEYNHKSEVIPIIQVGYERDLETQGESYVSPIHAGVPYFMKLIKTVSEFDLTNCLHAFPKLFQYVDSCSFKPDGKCTNSGVNVENCKQCNKTGIKLHTSAQDAVILKLPKEAEDMMDLSKMIHVETPSIDLLEFQNKLINEYVEKTNKAIFNSETFTKSEIAKTATGENIDMQNVYDTLKPFAEKVSDVWEHIARVSSEYLDYKNAIVAHAYPNDFKLKTSIELLSELEKATQSNAAGYIISSIENDIMREKYIDSPLEFSKYEAKQKYFPFKGKTRSEIEQIILSGMVRESDIILYNYFETIFSNLEDRYLLEGVWFYDLNPVLQRAAIDEEIQKIKDSINADKQITFEGGIS